MTLSTSPNQFLDTFHSIDTAIHAPISEKPYRTPIHYEEILAKKIDGMLKVPKPNGDVRVVDYRKINAISIIERKVTVNILTY